MPSTEERLAQLRAKLQARKSAPGLANNVKALEAEIARLEAELREQA